MSIPHTVGPRWHDTCPACGMYAPHAGATDEHGCELGPACLNCGHIARPRECVVERVAHAVRELNTHGERRRTGERRKINISEW